MAIADDCKAHSAERMPSLYAKGCNTARSAIAAKHKYIQQMDGKKHCANVVAALGNTHKSIICALRLVIISVFFRLAHRGLNQRFPNSTHVQYPWCIVISDKYQSCQSHAAPRTPLESPCLAWTIGVKNVSGTIYGSICSARV